ncbi:hypothetical protein AVEN_24692-1 [Araneus ventricosus]|uniref:Uncharacterized protein n=1 Tax=Araneus ventricosus TaxID=182803 RepID=A0A4Y2RBD5_ARAVE|nr:hypothetical protein AVEN_24692-1 [Araneus ventricosus]
MEDAEWLNEEICQDSFRKESDEDGDSNNLCSCSDPGVNSIDRKVFEELLKSDTSPVEINKAALHSVGLQADITAMKVQDKVENGSYKMDISKMISAMQTLKESLTKAEDKV